MCIGMWNFPNFQKTHILFRREISTIQSYKSPFRAGIKRIMFYVLKSSYLLALLLIFKLIICWHLFSLFSGIFFAPDPGRSKDRCMYLLYIHAVSVSNSKEVHDGKENENSEFSIKVLFRISWTRNCMGLLF